MLCWIKNQTFFISLHCYFNIHVAKVNIILVNSVQNLQKYLNI